MAISYKSFQNFVSDMIARWESDTNIHAVLVSGDPLLAAFNSGATQFIFLENLLQQVQLMARLSTSTGADVDSFLADFGLARLPATYASGQVTFSTATPAVNQIVIPAGSIVQTLGGAIQYQVVAPSDPTQVGWNATLNGYVIASGQNTVNATVQATLAGSIDNVQASQLIQPGNAVPGVATVTNNLPITNGLDAETDAAAKVRFVLFLASLSKATEAAILYAVTSVQQGLDVVLLDNETPNLETEYGFFTVVVDDGSGFPPASLLEAISTAVNAVRAFTIACTVIAPTVVNPVAALSIRVGPDAIAGMVIQNVRNALLDYVNSLPIGMLLYLNRLVEAAIDADPNVVSVQPGSVLINGEPQDLAITGVQLARLLAMNLSVGAY